MGLIAHAKAAASVGVPAGPVVTPAIDTTGAKILIAISSDYVGAGNTLGGGYTISDSKGNTWTALTFKTDATPNNQIAVWYSKSPTVGSGHTLSISGSFNTICFAAFDAVDTISPFDVEAQSNVASGTTLQPGSVTPANDGSLLILAETHQSSVGTFSATSFTEIDHTDLNSGVSQGFWAAYFIQTPAAAINPSIVVTTSADHRAATVKVFKPTGATPTNITVSDTMVLSDSLTTQLNDADAISDTIVLSDSLSTSLANIGFVNQTLSDTMVFNDLLQSAIQNLTLLNTTVGDAVALTDSLIILLQFNIIKSDSFTFTDSLASFSIISRTVSDSMSLSDSLTVKGKGGLLLGDRLVLSDLLLVSSAASNAYSDSIALSDSQSLRLTEEVKVGDAVALSDSTINNLISITPTNVVVGDIMALADSLITHHNDLGSDYLREYLNDALAIRVVTPTPINVVI